MSGRRRTAILISGRGSNMAAVIAACWDESFPAQVALVASNRPEAAGLQHAERNGVPTTIVDHKAFATEAAFERRLDGVLREAAIDLVCLAGFMRLLSPEFVEAWRDRLINIHPSLLPAFAGLNTHARALDAGDKLHGCTVHYVRAAMDNGPIIAQAAVRVLAGDTPETLAARVLAAEHELYPFALALVASGRVRVAGELVVSSEPPPPAADEAMLIAPPLDDVRAQ